MKSPLPKIIPFLGFAAATTFAQSPDKAPRPPADAPGLSPRVEHNLMFQRRPDGPIPMEKGTFLGVETAPVSATLTAQLNLPNGAGLVVHAVVPDSPAATVLKQHDVLLKIDDQLLIEPRQFSVLVRNHKEGDEVTLTYVRAGKEATARVKLVLHDVPKLASLGAHAFEYSTLENSELPGMDRGQVDHLLSMVHGAPGEPGRRLIIDRTDGPGVHLSNVNAGNSKMLYTDDTGVLELTLTEGKQTLVAKNAKGDQVFSGPVTTPDERKAMPPEVRDRLEKIEGMQEFSFKTGDGFKAGEMKVMRAPAQHIALPASQPPLPRQGPLVF